jgi:hypothetical protein
MSKHIRKTSRDSAVRSASAKRQQLPHEGAVRVARALIIREVRLVAFSAESSSDSVSDVPKVSVSMGFTKPDVAYSNKAVTITTTFRFRLDDAAISRSAAASPVVAIAATTQLSYLVNPHARLNADDLADFATVNAPFNAWPYWREFVQSSLNRLGLPPIALPLFRIEDAASFLLKEGQ